MSETLQLRQLVSVLVEPLSIACLLLLVGLVFGGRRQPLFLVACSAASLVFLWTMSTRWMAHQLLSPLERSHAQLSLDVLRTQSSDGIVAMAVLGGGSELDCSGTSESTFPKGDNRAQFAAALYRAASSDFFDHVVVSGYGASHFECPRSEAEVMSQWLIALGVPNERIVRESKSRNTAENAMQTIAWAASLKEKPTTLYVVTSAFHMRRAMSEFERALRSTQANEPSLSALRLVAAPTAAETDTQLTLSWRTFVPNARALRQSTQAIRERIALRE